MLITKNTVTNTVRVFSATPEQVRSFNQDDGIDNAIAGWDVETPEQLARTGLTERDFANLHEEARSHVPLPLGRPKRLLAEAVFPYLEKLARPYDLNSRKVAIAKASKKLDPRPLPEVTPPPIKKRVTAKKDGTFLLPAHEKARPAKAGTCIAVLIDATWHGASFEDLQKAVPNWQPASIISGLKYDVRQKGYGIKAEIADGILMYKLVLPKGLDKPLPHKE